MMDAGNCCVNSDFSNYLLKYAYPPNPNSSCNTFIILRTFLVFKAMNHFYKFLEEVELNSFNMQNRNQDSSGRDAQAQAPQGLGREGPTEKATMFHLPRPPLYLWLLTLG